MGFEPLTFAILEQMSFKVSHRFTNFQTCSNLDIFNFCSILIIQFFLTAEQVILLDDFSFVSPFIFMLRQSQASRQREPEPVWEWCPSVAMVPTCLRYRGNTNRWQHSDGLCREYYTESVFATYWYDQESQPSKFYNRWNHCIKTSRWLTSA